MGRPKAMHILNFDNLDDYSWSYCKVRFIKAERFLKNLEVDWKSTGFPALDYQRNKVAENDIKLIKGHHKGLKSIVQKLKNEFLILGLDAPAMEVVCYLQADPDDKEVVKAVI